MKTINNLLLLFMLVPYCLTAQDCPIFFSVQDADNKAQISGAAIQIDEIQFITQNTLDDGRAYFPRAPRGRLHYSVVKQGYLPEEGSINVACDKKSDNFKISMRKLPPPTMITVFGKIRSEKPLNFLNVKISINVAGKIWKAKIDEFGNYIFEIPEQGLKEQSFTLDVFQEGCPPISIEQKFPKDNILRINPDLCAENKSLGIIREELSTNFSALATLVASIEASKPSDAVIKMPGETEIEFQTRASNFRTKERDLILPAFDKFKINTETFNAHRLGINDQQLLSNVNNVYQKQREVVATALAYIEQINHVLSLNKPDAFFYQEILCKHAEKVTEAKMNLADAAGLYAYDLNDSLSIDILKLFLRPARLLFQSTTGKAFYKESRKILATLAQQKVENFAKCYKLPYNPIPKDSSISMENIRDAMDTIFNGSTVRPSVPLPVIDSSLKDPEKLLAAGTWSYMTGDSRATHYYYKVGLQNDTAAEHFKRYFQLSIERLDNAEKYDGGMGMMILKITPHNGFAKAGLKRFDVLTKINGKIIKEPKEINDELIYKKNSVIEYWRDGQKEEKIIKGGIQGGALVVPLIICEPVQL